MEPVYGIIKYRLPTEGAATYAGRALDILQSLEAVVPECLPLFLSSNSLLTLSGVRAYDAYDAFYDYLDEAQIEKVVQVLKDKGVVVLRIDASFTTYPDPDKQFELVHVEAFRNLWTTYELPRDSNVADVIEADIPIDNAHLVAWMYFIEHELANAMDNRALPRAWMNDWWAPHHARVGMLLGYPGKAIESLLWEGSLIEAGEERMDAEISHAGNYFAAWPVYNYKLSLKTDPEIVAHQKLWSDILELVYESDWHKRVKTTESFQKIMQYITIKESPPPLEAVKDDTEVGNESTTV